MTGFEAKFKRIVNPYERAKIALEEYSRSGDAAIDCGSLAEPASFGVLLKSASDVHGAAKKRLSAPNKLPASEVLEHDHIVISAIGFSRNDIATTESVARGRAGKFKFKMVTEGRYCGAIINNDADDLALFNRETWEAERFSALDTALDHGANIICFGETDYPPSGEPGEEIAFQRRILAKIDASDHPVFLVAGTRHDFIEEKSQVICVNRARIFANLRVRNVGGDPIDGETVILHDKLNSAERAGERIEGPERPRIIYYHTALGKIAVLICVDAYNPAVLLSILENRARRGEDQLDYILVPSYNYSPKLYYSCQVLSLMSGTVVVLVDACAEDAVKPAETAVFVHGRLFSHILDSDECTEAGRFLSAPPHSPVRSCSLSVDYLRDLRSTGNSPTPFLDSVADLFVNQINRGTA